MLWNFPKLPLAPDLVFQLPFLPPGQGITNTLLCTWLSIIVLALLAFFSTRRRDMIPTGMQNFAEWAVESLLGLVEGVSGKEKGRKFFPLVATFFLFIFLCNLLDVIPGVDTFGWIEPGHPNVPFFLFGNNTSLLIPWFRPATSDLNLTLSMALVSVVVTQIFGFTMLGPLQHLGKYFQIKSLFQKGPMGIIDIFVGLLELVTETARLISFSFRLFGNIFAGSVLLAVFAFLLPFVANIVFIPFEIFVGFIQAFVFSVLTLAFMELGTTSHEHHVETPEEAHRDFEQKSADEQVAAH